MSIAENLVAIKKTIPAHVTLVAVSKTKPMAAIMEAYASGQRHFGENYIQELQEKQAQLPTDICWHFIGHLQSNKVKYIAPYVHLIHGVDSLKLLQEINKQAVKNKRIISCLLQVYIATEESKFGLLPEEVIALLNSPEFEQLEHIHIEGLMGMASFSENQELLAKEFSGLKQLFDQLGNQFGGKGFEKKGSDKIALNQLSMGMSGDYQLAIKHGSTMVRIGSSIFGSRNYSLNV